MPKKAETFADHWRELRYHMIAGLFWYLAGFISWGWVTESFHYLREHIGLFSTILIDVTCFCLIFYIFSKIKQGTSDSDKSEHPPLSVVQVWAEREDPTTPPEVVYRNRLRIAIRNDSHSDKCDVEGYWIANGNVSLQLPEKLKFRNELNRGSWRDMKWSLTERVTATLSCGDAVSTWVGLSKQLSDAEFGRARENREFGTLVIRIVGQDEEVHIPI